MKLELDPQFGIEAKEKLNQTYIAQRGRNAGEITGKALAVLKAEMREKGWVVGGNFEKCIKESGLKIVKANCITRGTMKRSQKQFERRGKTCLVVTEAHAMSA